MRRWKISAELTKKHHYDVEAVKRLFPVEGYEAVAIVPIGHIAPDCPQAEKKRKEMNEIFKEV